MRRLLLIGFVLVVTFAGRMSVAHAASNLPDGPQAKGDGLEFSIYGAIKDKQFGDPLNWGPNDDGRQFLLVSLYIKNTNSDKRELKPDNFQILNGKDDNGKDVVIKADGKLSDRPRDALRLEGISSGFSGGTSISAGDNIVYMLGWRVPPDLKTFKLKFNYGSGKTVDLKPWLDQKIKPSGLIPPNTAPFNANRSLVLGDHVTLSDVDVTPTSYADIGATTLYQPHGKFIAVAITLYNNANTNKEFDSGRLQLYSASTKRFTQLEREATLDYNDFQDDFQYSGNVEPGLTYTTNLVFDVSPDSSDFWLAVDVKDESAGSAIHLDPDADARSGGSSAGGQDIITGCSEFANYDEAQSYFVDHPEVQPYLDPNQDGRACEVHFNRG